MYTGWALSSGNSHSSLLEINTWFLKWIIYFIFFATSVCFFVRAGLRTGRAAGWTVVSTVSTSTGPWRSNGPEQRTRVPTRVWPTASWVKPRTRSAWRSKVRHDVVFRLASFILSWLNTQTCLCSLCITTSFHQSALTDDHMVSTACRNNS